MWLQGECDVASNISMASELGAEITLDELQQVIRSTANWKAADVDSPKLLRFTSLHPYLRTAVNNMVNTNEEMPFWLTRGVSYLLPKTGDSNLHKNNRQITCLPTMYKIITAAIASKIYGHLQLNNLLPIEQKGCRKGSFGATAAQQDHFEEC